MNKRTRACSISQKVKRIVWDRDGGQCIFCGNTHALPEGHVISRAHGGLGIPENIITVCRSCHDRMDNSTDRGEMVLTAKIYLRSIYPNWSEEKCTYKKGE